MNSPVFFIEAVIIGIALITALNHTIMALVLHDRTVHLLFVVLALAVCGFEIGNLRIYSATSPAELVTINKWKHLAALVFTGTLPWFATRFNKLRSLVVPIGLSAVSIILIVISFASPYGVAFSLMPELIQLRLPWGETIARAEHNGIWMQIVYAQSYLTLGYVIFIGFSQLRVNPTGPAMALLAGCALFLPLALLNYFIALGDIEFVFVVGWGFLLLVIPMSAYVTEQLYRSYQQEKDYERQLHLIFDHADALVYLKDRSGVYRLINKQFEKVVGVRKDEVVGKTVFDVFPQRQAQLFEANDALVYQKGMSLEFEEAVAQQGEKRIYHTVKFPLRNDQGGIIGMCGIATDITERKIMENALRKQENQVELEVSRRTEELSSTYTELEAFSYAVAHDLRTPLIAISGLSQVLLKRFRNRLDEEGQQFLQQIIESSSNMNEMITALLEMSRVTKKQIKKVPVDLTALARDVTKQLGLTDPQRAITVSIQEGLQAQGSTELLKIMLTNLIGNAWKYTGKEPSPRIEVGSIQADGHTTFFVKDNGTGFDMAQQDRLFQPFQRLHSEQEFSGTGIGLSNVRRIVERHGGKIWAESKPGQGATFFFRI